MSGFCKALGWVAGPLGSCFSAGHSSIGIKRCVSIISRGLDLSYTVGCSGLVARRLPAGVSRTPKGRLCGELGDLPRCGSRQDNVGMSAPRHDDIGGDILRCNDIGKSGLRCDDVGRSVLRCNDVGRSGLRSEDVGSSGLGHDNVGRSAPTCNYIGRRVLGCGADGSVSRHDDIGSGTPRRNNIGGSTPGHDDVGRYGAGHNPGRHSLRRSDGGMSGLRGDGWNERSLVGYLLMYVDGSRRRLNSDVGGFSG
jgi:hypothetical protein